MIYERVTNTMAVTARNATTAFPVDVKGAASVTFFAIIAAASAVNFKLTESDDNVTFTDVPIKDMRGEFGAKTTTVANQVIAIGYAGYKRYARLDIVAGATVGAVAVLDMPRYAGETPSGS